MNLHENMDPVMEGTHPVCCDVVQVHSILDNLSNDETVDPIAFLLVLVCISHDVHDMPQGHCNIYVRL